MTSKLKGNRSGQIAYVGEVDFKPDEVMIGVVLDEVNNARLEFNYKTFLASWKTRRISGRKAVSVAYK